MKRRHRQDEVDLSLLPPIESLVPDELKNFTKEELSAYLESKGIQPKVTKPEMKRQLRLVLQALREHKPELILRLQQDALNNIIETPRKLSRPADFPRPQGPGGASIAGVAAGQEGDAAMCQGPGCRKKANRECDFALCRSCCTRDGFLCYIHMNDVQRRGNETHIYRDHPFVKGTAEVGTFLPLGQRRAHRESIAQALVSGGQVQASSLSGEHPSNYLSGHALSDSRDDSAALKEQMVWMETCPGCGVPVAASGSLFLLHLGHCSPDLLDRLLSNNNQLSNKWNSKEDQDEEMVEEMRALASVGERGVDEELEPVDKMKANAALRYKRQKAGLKMLFTNEPPLLEAIGGGIINFAERKECLERITRKLEDIVEEDASQISLETEKQNCKSFQIFLSNLESATTVDEVAAQEAAFERQHSIILHAGNVSFNVHRHSIGKRKRDGESSQVSQNEEEHWPLPLWEPLSATTPGTVELAQL